MKFVMVFFVVAVISCGGSLSKEQRKKMRENMEAKSLKKVNDAELTEAAMAYGRKVAGIVATRANDRGFLDSLEKVYDVEILFMQPGSGSLRTVERQIIDAYASGSGTNLSDNIQKMGSDSLLYTKPMGKERPDGSIDFTKALALRLHKKAIVLSIKE